MNDDGRRSLEEWLRSAWGPHAGCPPPEGLLPAELGALDPAERRRLEAHLRDCPACAAERDLARAFERELAIPDADVQHVVRRLRRGPARPRRRILGLALAAAAVLAVAALALPWGRWSVPPPVPAAPSAELPVRGAVIGTLEPEGAIPSRPDRLAWETVTGAAAYEVTLKRPDGEVLWNDRVGGTEAVLPPGVKGTIEDFVVYSWTVIAMNDNGRTLGRSRWIRFQVRPVDDEVTP